jgi:hypothetical protein
MTDRSWQKLARAALVAGVALRALLACRSVETLDDLFVPDDTYYTLSVARALAHGGPPSTDGVTLTNGFQPLQAFLLVPVFWLTRSADGALRGAIVLSALADTAALALLRRFSTRAAGPAAGALTAAAWAFSPLALGNALNGLESSSAIALVVGALVAWQEHLATPRTRTTLLTGALWGCAVLARIDAALAALVFAAVCAAKRDWRFLGGAGVAALVVVSPWWAYELTKLGTVVPESGSAVRELASVHRGLYLDLRRQLAWAVGTLLASPFALWPRARMFLFDSAPATAAATVLWLAGVAAATRAAWRSLHGPAARAPFAALVLWSGAIAAFYVVVLPAIWFYPRYLLPAVAASAVVFGVAGAALEASPARPVRVAWRSSASVLFAVAAAFAVCFAVTEPHRTVDAALDGAKGYRRAALEVLAKVPDGAVVGALQSGALGYYALYGPARVRVVNLDGVVSAGAAAAFKDGRLDAFAREQGVTHVADWPFNVEILKSRSRASDRIVWTPLAKASPQGDEAMELFAVEWPDDGSGVHVPAVPAGSR